MKQTKEDQLIAETYENLYNLPIYDVLGYFIYNVSTGKIVNTSDRLPMVFASKYKDASKVDKHGYKKAGNVYIKTYSAPGQKDKYAVVSYSIIGESYDEIVNAFKTMLENNKVSPEIVADIVNLINSKKPA